MADETGALRERYSYDPYGKPFIEKWDANANEGEGAWLPSVSASSTAAPGCTWSDGGGGGGGSSLACAMPVSSVGNSFGFTGHVYLPAIAKNLAHFRVYDPRLGRWLQRDPIEYAAGAINLYEYVASAPLFWIDPLGLVPHWHHWYPQSLFRDEIKGLDIDATENGVMIEGDDHIKKIHSGWNQEWKRRIEKRKREGKPVTKDWAKRELEKIKKLDRFKDTLKKGKPAKERYKGPKNGPPQWKAKKVKKIKRLAAVGGVLVGFLSDGASVIAAFSDPDSPCTKFADQLSNGVVNNALCHDCALHLGDEIGGNEGGALASKFDQDVCAKLPPDGDYSGSPDSCGAK